MLMLGAGIIIFEFWFANWVQPYVRFYKYMLGRGVVVTALGAIAAPGKRQTEEIAGWILLFAALVSFICPVFGIWYAPPPLMDSSGSGSSDAESGNVPAPPKP